ncbi:amidohydrolase family protein [Actinopolymorpha sp. B17G11]|uniref:amidohydrolase family protein n=1 Tax=Actinopolymorpha sp. B17G11 TaxID=3160861 RepID=UPI0032E474B3
MTSTVTGSVTAEQATTAGPLGERGRAALFSRRPLEGVRVVDAHAHAGPYSRFFIPDHDVPGMVGVMDRCGVSVAFVSTHLALELDVVRGNALTAELVDRAAGRFRGLVVVNPHHDPEATLARWIDDPRFVGVKLHPDLHEYPATGTRYEPVWRAAEKLGFPVLVHSWAGSAFDDLRHFATLAERHPAATVVLGHSGARRPHFEEAAELAARHPGLVLELCGSFMTSYWVRRLVEIVGPDRVLFGSDFPFIDLRYSLGRTLFADLADDDLAKVLGDSASRLVRRFRPDDPAFAPPLAPRPDHQERRTP